MVHLGRGALHRVPRGLRTLTVLAGSLAAIDCAHLNPSASLKPQERAVRLAAIKRAQVWMPTDVASKDMKSGPPGPGAIAAGSTVVCDFVEEDLSGTSPKFACSTDEGRKLKVKYGKKNGEVYAEVAATRLLWALGFGADREYPARVVCRGCPARLQGLTTSRDNETVFEVSAVEIKAAGRELEWPPARGWAWPELDLVDPDAGGASLAERDALKLLAVFLQHTDSKPDQQRLVCLSGKSEKTDGTCTHTFMMMNDVGLTFGRANRFNRRSTGSVNLKGWSRTPVWRGPSGCIGNLSRSLTGTLDEPRISEEGRRFLADLLTQLTDDQLRELFEVARFPLLTPMPRSSKGSAVQAWVDAFRQKRDQIVNRRCPSAIPARAN
jgi:hypothetical protein